MDLQLKTTSGDVACSTVVAGTPENMGIAGGIPPVAVNVV